MPFKKVEIKEVVDIKRLDDTFERSYREIEKEYDLIRQVVKVRKELGITQKSLAAQTGVSQQEISRFENEKHIPKLSNFLRILDALGLELKIEQKENHVQ